MKRGKLPVTAATLTILVASVFGSMSKPAQASDPVITAEVPRYSAELDLLRQQFTANGDVRVELAKAEYITTMDGFNPVTSQTVIANDRTQLLGVQFVQNDPRRDGRSFLTYVVDQSDGGALTLLPSNIVGSLPNSITEPAIDQGMAKWQSVPCNGTSILKVVDTGGNIDIADDLVFRRSPGSPIADITHGGWIPSGFFNVIAPGGARFILAVAISFVFLDEDGVPTDIDNNGRADTAFMEIYYNRGFPWSQGGDDLNIDVGSIATHESGHALGLYHFGRVFLTKNGSTVEDIKYAPRAVMNAVYVSPFPELAGTDEAAFCRIWANSD